MAKIIYQKLDIPIESRISPFAEECQEMCELLFDKYNIFDEEMTRRFHEQKLTYFATLAYHYASKEVIQIISNYIAWAFVFDDYIETHHDEREETCERVLQIAYGNLTPKEGEMRPLEALFSEIWDSIKKLSPHKWQKRFIGRIRTWFFFAQALMKHKVNDTIPSKAEYLSYRWFDAANDMVINLIEFAMQKFFPQSFHSEMVIQHLVHAAGDAIVSINEIFSYEKEIRAKHLNLVTMVKNEKKIEVQEAIDRIYVFSRAQFQTYFALRKQFNRFYDMTDEVMRKYLYGMDYVTRGGYDCHFYGNRYFKNMPFKIDSPIVYKFE
ncbi:hypothetical protein B4U79_16780 [Dinothrombium tinctorium]|uniref:Terpene synthase n=1 Tax=Dinothrombium tinctorium TaxID=1965070 RepID=A0A3S3RKI9_9ACAR|nr:hypothetical protein B4U79_16780 [Dinothrombium tinctorium]